MSSFPFSRSAGIGLVLSACVAAGMIWGTARNAAPQSGTSAPPAATAAMKPLRWQPLYEPGSGGWMTGFAISPHDKNRMLVSGDMLGIGLSTNGGKTWESTFGLKSYEIGDLTWHPKDPNIVWAGTMSGPYVSTDGGRNWQEKRSGFPPLAPGQYSAPIEKVLFTPGNPKRLLAIGGSSRRWESPGKPLYGIVWESNDAGETWKQIASLGSNIVSAAFAAGDPNTVYVVLDKKGIRKSADGGKTWADATNNLPHPAAERIIAHPKDPKTLWVSLDNHKPQGAATCKPGGIYRTVDGGTTWESISNGLSQKAAADSNLTARYKAFAVAPSNPNVMYTADHAWDAGILYGTKDGGKSWQRQASGKEVPTAYFAGLAGTVMAVDPNNPNVAFCVGSEHIIGTQDGGAKWADVGNDRVSGTGKETAWRGRGYSGLCSVNFAFHPTRKGDALLLGMDAGKLWRSRDDLKSWTYHGHNPWPWGGGVDAVFAGKTIYATAGQFGQFLGILRSTDDGATWTVLGGAERGLPKLQSSGQPSAIYARPDAPEQVWAIIAGKLYASSDSGEKWAVVQDGLKLDWLVGDPKAPSRFYLSGAAGVYVTEDGGKTVTAIGGPKPATRLSVDNKGRVLAASWRSDMGGVWRYDSGTWTRLWDEKYVYSIAADPNDPTRLAVATHDHPYHDATYATGVWVSADDGKTWRQASDGLPVLRGESITFDPHNTGRLVFGTHGRGFFITTWPKGVVPATAAKSYTQTSVDTTKAARPESFPVTIEAPQATSSAAGIASLLRNADFSAGDAVPNAWTQKWVGSGALNIVRDTKVFKDGPAALRLESVGGAAKGQVSQIIEAGGKRTVNVRGWLKTEGAVKVNVAVQPFTADWKPIGFMQVAYAQNAQDWAAFEGKASLPENTARFGVVLFLEGNGKAYLDSVKISE